MEACSSVEKEVDKVKNKFSSLKKSLNISIDDHIAAIDRLQRILAEQSNENVSEEQNQTAESLHNISEGVNKIATEHRYLHSSVSEVGKYIDRNFVSNFDCTSQEDEFVGPGKASLLTDVILHMLLIPLLLN